ncbi:MAG: hypothetical protein RLZZ209_503, partial [Bacteroidota bacterium]
AYVLRIALGFKLLSKLWTTLFYNLACCKDMNEVWLDVTKDACVVGNEKQIKV